MSIVAGQSSASEIANLSRNICVQPRALAVPELALPAASEGLDIAVLRHDQGVLLSRGGSDEALAVDLDAHLDNNLKKNAAAVTPPAVVVVTGHWSLPKWSLLGLRRDTDCIGLLLFLLLLLLLSSNYYCCCTWYIFLATECFFVRTYCTSVRLLLHARGQPSAVGLL